MRKIFAAMALLLVLCSTARAQIACQATLPGFGAVTTCVGGVTYGATITTTPLLVLPLADSRRTSFWIQNHDENSKCTANVAPYACCTGAATGTCNGTICVSFAYLPPPPANGAGPIPTPVPASTTLPPNCFDLSPGAPYWFTNFRTGNDSPIVITNPVSIISYSGTPTVTFQFTQ